MNKMQSYIFSFMMGCVIIFSLGGLFQLGSINLKLDKYLEKIVNE